MNRALINYVKYFYDNNDDVEEILTENLKMICFALGLKEDEIKRQINKIPAKDLRSRELAITKKPDGINSTLARKMYLD